MRPSKIFTLFLSVALAYSFNASANDYISPKANANRLSGTQKRYKTVDENETTTFTSADGFRGDPLIYRNNISAGIGLNYFDAFGLQARYAARILDEGFIPDVNDSFFLEGGVGLTFYGDVNGKNSVTGFNFNAAGRWDFQYDRQWIFFGTLGFGYNAVAEESKDHVSGDGVFPVIGGGAIFNITEEIALRGDVSYNFFGIGGLFRF